MMLKSWRVRGVAAVGALLVAMLVVAVPAQESAAQEPPATCPDPYPLADVEDGDTGTGYVTVEGTEPTPFDAEVVRVVEDLMAPGRDVIVAELSGEAIEQADTEAPWGGMSGAPVYTDDDRLLGAVALRLGDGIAGLTPAERLLDLAEGAAAGTASTAGHSAEAEMDDEDRRAIAQSTDASAQQLSTERLPVPLQVAGLGPDRLDALRDGADEHGLSLAIQPAQTDGVGGQISQDAVDSVGPGTAIAQRLAAGDVSAYNAGTVSLVCDQQAVAMGHPIALGGEVDTGANLAEVASVSDSGFGFPITTALLGEPVGRIGQDRLAGLRAQLGEQPDETRITTEITDTVSDGSRTGTTRVAEPGFLPLAVSTHVGRNIEAVQNRSGEGTAVGSFTLAGTTADGEDWELTRENRYASQSLIGAPPGNEASGLLAQLQHNEFADVTVDEVDMAFDVDADYADLRLERLEATVGDRTLELDPADPEPFEVQPGEEIQLSAQLRPWQQPDRRETAQLTLQAPADHEGPVMLRVASPLSPGLGVPHQARVALDALHSGTILPPRAAPPSPDDVDSFDGLVDHLSERPRNDELVAELVPESATAPVEGGPPVPHRSGVPSPDAVASDTHQLDAVVRGPSYEGPVFVGDPHGPPPPEPPLPRDGPGEPGAVERLAGPDRVGTAVAISRADHPQAEGVDTVVIARAGEFADALAGGPLAAHHDAPLLLARQGALPEATAAEIARLEPQRAVVLGGTGAVSPAAVDQLDELVDQVDRVAGGDRYATAAAIAERLPGSGPVYVAAGAADGEGSAWADALSAGAAAAADGGAVLLTAPDQLPPATARALDGDQPVVIVGGEAAVSPAVQSAVAQQAGDVTRVAGRTRYDTAVTLARRLVTGASAPPPAVWLATGQAAPDALAAAPAAADEGPLLLVDGRDLQRSPATEEALHELGPVVERLVLVGGDSAIGEEVAAQIRSLAGSEPPPPDGDGS